MSLVCHACGNNMGSSETFPGREGTMVYPHVLSMIWVPDNDPSNKKWALGHIQAPYSISLCFKCVAKKFPPDRQHILDAVYAACETEVRYRRLKEAEEGKWFSGGEGPTWTDAFHEWEARRNMIPLNRCLFCDKTLPDKQNPFFTARVVDRVYSEKHPSLWLTGFNYSWSDFKAGSTGFRICFECFKEHFLALFDQLSCDLRGVVGQNQGNAPKSELYLTPEFLEALKQGVGEEETREILRGASEIAEVRLLIDPRDTMSQN